MAFDLSLALMKELELDMQKWKKKKSGRTALTKAQMWERLGRVAKY